MKKALPVLAFMAVVFLLASCKNEDAFTYNYYNKDEKAILDQHLKLNDTPEDYDITLPAHLAQAGLFPRPVSDDKATLGRVLFYDKKLSKDATIACASCHKQELGFGDDKAISPGVFDRVGDRNSIALGSVASFSAYYGTDLNGSGAIRFFWDNRAGTAKDQSRGSMTNPAEMDMTMSEIVEVVKQQPYYAPLFNKSFDYATFPANVSEENVLDCIANFVDAMGSFDSKFDREAAAKYTGFAYGEGPVHETFDGFTDAENRGKTVYMNACKSCHSPVMGRPTFNYASNGLDAVTGKDRGVGGVDEFAASNLGGSLEGVFKVPTLRNCELSAPYMHDGRFKSLEEVVEHYSTGIQSHPNLHGNLTAGGFDFTQQQKSDLVAFLKTLTDNQLVVEPRFSNPFK